MIGTTPPPTTTTTNDSDCTRLASELHANAMIATHRRVIHMHYPRIFSLFQDACEDYCPSILNDSKEDSTMTRFAKQRKRNHHQTTSTRDGCSSSYRERCENTSCIYDEHVVDNDEQQLQQQQQQQGCSNHHHHRLERTTTTTTTTTTEREELLLVKDVLCSWIDEIESYMAYESNFAEVMVDTVTW
jgi:hypothetical protein